MTSIDLPTDQVLMQLVQGGDHTALGQLFTRHGGSVYRYLLRWLGDPQAAEDLVQETFLRVLRRGETAPLHERLRPWLLRIARNLAIDEFRRARPVALVEAEEPFPDPGPLPLERLTLAERNRQLTAAMALLAPAHREILVLRAIEGMDHGAIGTAMGCSEGAARVRVHRATVALRAIWHANFGGIHD